MSDFFSRLRKKIFGDSIQEELAKKQKPPASAENRHISSVKKAKGEHPPVVREPQPNESAVRKARPSQSKRPNIKPTRDAYFFQIGLDFGTAFTKCIVRDVAKDTARVFVPQKHESRQLPFLLSSRLERDRFVVARPAKDSTHYGENTISLLKMALVNVVLGQNGDHTSQSIHAALSSWGVPEMEKPAWVEGLTALYLASVIQDLRADLLHRFPDYGNNEKDYTALNLAIPVAEMESAPVRAAFERALHVAWHHHVSAVLPMDVRDWMALIKPTTESGPSLGANSPCFVYPEVSANVQGFVRSRSSKPGVYLFTDTGAGTVDQSVFIFSRHDHERLVYLGAQVLPLGSAMQENLAITHAQIDGSIDIEHLRKAKEDGRRHPDIEQVRNTMAAELTIKTTRLLGVVKVNKLNLGPQLNETELIFGGGGHSEHPYETGVLESFKATIFPEGLRPRAIGLPIPSDLEFPKGVSAHEGMRRLSVAYGLSFLKDELAPFTFPDAVQNAKRVWHRREPPPAPTMDDC